ncbi:MAG: hypothetical protein GQ527_09830 [Bacteroidales bacterium]|nr:hypothetical protein [Bacteroidales bacterium]
MRKQQTWKPITKVFNQGLNDALQQQHQAVQLIAMVGRHLIAQQDDDSNTNMQYYPQQKMMVGNELENGLRVAVDLESMYLKVLDKDFQVKKQLALEGKSKKMAIEKLRNMLWDLNVDVSNFKGELHYEIPKHSLDKGDVFIINDEDDFIENAKYRNNAEIVLNEIAKDFKIKEQIKVWPHHFDTGSFIPVSHNKKGELSQSIGLGFSIPDTMVDEPYYYLSFWSGKPIKKLEKPEELVVGKWMTPKWNGAILKLSDIMKVKSAKVQQQIVKDFYESGFKILSPHFKI